MTNSDTDVSTYETYAMPDDAPASEDSLTAIVNLARQQIQLEDQLAEAEAFSNGIKQRLQQISQFLLPNAMEGSGIEELTLTGGHKLKLDVKLVSSPKKDELPGVYTWLEDNNHGDLIKHAVGVNFGRKEDTLVASMIDWIKTNLPKHKYIDVESVNYQTMQAFVKEQTKAGVELPEELITLILHRSVITREASIKGT